MRSILALSMMLAVTPALAEDYGTICHENNGSSSFVVQYKADDSTLKTYDMNGTLKSIFYADVAEEHDVFFRVRAKMNGYIAVIVFARPDTPHVPANHPMMMLKEPDGMVLEVRCDF